MLIRLAPFNIDRQFIPFLKSNTTIHFFRETIFFSKCNAIRKCFAPFISLCEWSHRWVRSTPQQIKKTKKHKQYAKLALHIYLHAAVKQNKNKQKLKNNKQNMLKHVQTLHASQTIARASHHSVKAAIFAASKHVDPQNEIYCS